MSPFRSLQSPAGIARSSFTALRAAALGLGVFGLMTVGAGASAENGLLDDYEYESPTYGYTVEWDNPWAASERDTESEKGIDFLYLISSDSSVWVMSMPTDYDVASLVEAVAESGAGDYDEVEILEQGEAGGAAYALIQWENEDGSTMLVYCEAEEIVEAGGRSEPAIVVISALFAGEASFEESLETATETIELDGDPIFSTLDADSGEEEDEEERGSRDEDEDEDADRDEDEDENQDEDEDEDERGGRSDDDEDEDRDGDEEEDEEDEQDEDEDDRDSRDDEEDEEEDERA